MLTANEELHDDVRDDAGNVTSVATGVILGLRAAGLPVCVLERRDRVDDVAGWESRVADVAVARTDRVTVAHYNSVHGMERRVVVWLAEWRKDWGGDPVYLDHRLHGLSRCTTQLVVIDPAPPPANRHTENNDSTNNSDTLSEEDTDDKDETTNKC